jgi:hypothetical protein
VLYPGGSSPALPSIVVTTRVEDIQEEEGRAGIEVVSSSGPPNLELLLKLTF